jgi:hypothetical protein
MDDWDKLDQQFSGTAPAAATASRDPWDQLDASYARPAARATTSNNSARSAPARTPAREVGTRDRIQAAASGINRGLFSDIAGLPVDTFANVLDLGRAAIGTAAVASGHPEYAPDIPDRKKIVGSSAWLAKKFEDTGLGAAVNNQTPQDAASRILHTGGRYAGASVVPSSRVPLSVGVQATNAGMGAVSGLLSGGVEEVAPEWAGLAGMAPSLGVMGGAGAVKLAVRGGEAGRQRMSQRVQDLKAGGIDSPSVGLATGRPSIMGLENLLAQTPFSGGLYAKAGEANIAGMKAKTQSVRDGISSEYGPVVAGQAVQNDIQGVFRDRTKATAGRLADKVAGIVGRDTIVPVNSSIDKARQLSTPTKGAEATSGALIQPRIARIADNLETDVYGPRVDPQKLNVGNPTRNSAISSLPQLRDGAGLMNSQPAPRPVANPSIWNEPILRRDQLPQRGNASLSPGKPGDSLMNVQKLKGIPFGALKSLRTSIGDETQSSAIMGTPEQAQFKQLYGAMSQDMRQAASAADRTRAGIDIGPLTPGQQPAGVALNRANKHFSAAMNRAEELKSLVARSTPEGAYGAVEQSLRNGPTTWERTRSAVTPGTRQKVAATMIDEMGMATPGQQTAAGDAWSPRTFLTNYSKLYENGGGKALFTRLPGGQSHADNLASIAKAAEMVGGASKVWANPSGTAPALTARATMYTLTAGAFMQPMLAATTAGGLVGARQVSQRLLLNPKFVSWLAKSPNVSPAQARAHAQRLMATATMSRDPQFQQDASDYLDLVEQGQQQ